MKLKQHSEIIITKDSEGNEKENIIDITLFLGRNAWNLALRLGKLILPLFKILGGQEIGDKPLEIMKIKLTPQILDDLIDSLIVSLDESKMLTLVLDLLKNTEINNLQVSRPEIFDQVFQGDLSLLLKVLKIVIVENFTPFFKENHGFLNQIMKIQK